MINIKSILTPIMLGAMLLNLGGSPDANVANTGIIERTSISSSVEAEIANAQIELDDKGFDDLHTLGTKKKTKKKSKKKTKKSSKKKKRKKSKKSRRVYWTRYGKCYHRRSTCPASRTVFYGSKSEAQCRGLRPCKKCC